MADINFLREFAETEEFFDYIGDPLPGFEYKWPEGDESKL